MAGFKEALVGATLSGVIAGGAYFLETDRSEAEVAALAACRAETEQSQARDECITDVEDKLGDKGMAGLAELVGGVGVVGFLYLGYKNVKTDLGNSGIIDDYFKLRQNNS